MLGLPGAHLRAMRGNSLASEDVSRGQSVRLSRSLPVSLLQRTLLEALGTEVMPIAGLCCRPAHCREGMGTCAIIC